MGFVIRSMSTTDYRPGHKVEPYHCYLMPAEKRARAFWSSMFHAMRFETEAEAQAEIDRCRLTNCDIAPVDHEATGFPTYWDRRITRGREG